MKIWNLLKSEFVKNYSIKRFVVITIILTIASILLINVNKPYSYNMTINESLMSWRNSLKEKVPEELIGFEERYSYEYTKNYVDYMTSLEKKGVNSYYDYRVSLIQEDLLPLILENYAIKELKQNPNDSYIVLACNSNQKIEQESESFQIINKLCREYEEESRKILYKENNSKINDYQKLLDTGKYYEYLEYQIKNGKAKQDEITNLLIEKKVSDGNSFLVKNYEQYKNLEENANLKIKTEEEYKKQTNNIENYKEYQRYYSKLKKEASTNRMILLYSTKNNIKHDLTYNYEDNMFHYQLYKNTKQSVNQVFHLSIVVALILCVTSGKIVSGEHNKGTIKNIITAPVRRWKILFSKFLYMIIDSYLLWILGLLIITICSGIEFGFHDLLTPKLVYINGSVIEVNYFLYILKDMLITSIPLVAFISVIFCFSTVSLNTSLTVGVTSALASISACLWLMSAAGNIKSIVYTPFWYLDCGFIYNNSYLYTESLRKVSYSLTTGIMISIVIIIILYLISNFVYNKRDIKN